MGQRQLGPVAVELRGQLGQHRLGPGHQPDRRGFRGAPFTFLTGKTLISITDGTSNTLMLSELLTPKGPNWEGPIGDGLYACGGHCFDSVSTPNSSVVDEVDRMCPTQPATPNDVNRCTVNPTGVSATFIPNTNHMTARSNHTGGVNAAMCDGSVRFVTNGIDLASWQALSTATGGDVATNSN